MKTARTLMALAVAAGLSACKIEVTAPEHGSVITESGSFLCEAGDTCSIDVYDLHYKETFYVTPNEGYEFVEWKKDNRYLCGGNASPCRIETAGMEGNEALMAVLESDEVFFLEPVFVAAEEALALTLTGTWDYTHKLDGCTATGRIVQEVIPGEGVYQTFQAGSQQVAQRPGDDCQYNTASQDTRSGPIASIQTEPLRQSELNAAYQELFGDTVFIYLESADQYTVRSATVEDVTTYRRVTE